MINSAMRISLLLYSRESPFPKALVRTSAKLNVFSFFLLAIPQSELWV